MAGVRVITTVTGALLAAFFFLGCGSSSGSDCTPTAELCNGLDDDCNDQTDEIFAVGEPCTSGVGACQRSGSYLCAEDGAGVVCDATPGEPIAETCNQSDDDCDGQTDEEVTDCCTPATQLECGVNQGACIRGLQTCSATGDWGACLAGGVPVVLPGQLEELCDGVDQDCDASIDEDLTAPTCPLQLGVCAGSRASCGGAEGWLECDAAQYGGAYEAAEATCDGLDNDCDGATDESLRTTFYRDADSDTYGSASTTIQACILPSGYVTNVGDCNDSNGGIHPDAAETCNGVDDDCDGQTDESLSGPFCPLQAGVCAGSRASCGGAEGWLECSATEYGNQYEAAEATCDSLDNDCDGATDETLRTTFYRDADSDTYGSAGTTIQACTLPSGYVTNVGDCNDSNGGIHPDATEACNLVDDDCDGQTDEPPCT